MHILNPGSQIITLQPSWVTYPSRSQHLPTSVSATGEKGSISPVHPASEALLDGSRCADTGSFQAINHSNSRTVLLSEILLSISFHTKECNVRQDSRQDPKRNKSGRLDRRSRTSRLIDYSRPLHFVRTMNCDGHGQYRQIFGISIPRIQMKKDAHPYITAN